MDLAYRRMRHGLMPFGAMLLSLNGTAHAADDKGAVVIAAGYAQELVSVLQGAGRGTRCLHDCRCQSGSGGRPFRRHASCAAIEAAASSRVSQGNLAMAVAVDEDDWTEF